ncbi:MAG: transposase-like protein [Porticoccus sp.]|jgi:transposase-like protein
MSTKTRRTFSPEFRLDSAQLFVDQNYSIQEAALVVGVGHSTMDKWARQLRKERADEAPKALAMTHEHRRIKELKKQLRRAAAIRIDVKKIKLNALVKSAHKISNGSAGARSIAHIVTEQGAPLSRYRAASFMKRLDLVSKKLPKHRYKKPSQPHAGITNVLDRKFSPTAPN